MTIAGFSYVGKIYDRLTVIAELPRYTGPNGVSLRKWQWPLLLWEPGREVLKPVLQEQV